jgi:hypothetical protein
MGVENLQVEMRCSDIDIQCLAVNRLKDHRVYSTRLDGGAQPEFETKQLGRAHISSCLVIPHTRFDHVVCWKAV